MMLSPKFIIQVSKGLLRNQRARRLMMFYGIIIAMVLLFFGSTFLENRLRQNLLLFVIYWGACAWLTILVLGMALLDILLIRSAARRERKRLEAEYLRKQREDLEQQ
jgi:hypothetical protein